MSINKIISAIDGECPIVKFHEFPIRAGGDTAVDRAIGNFCPSIELLGGYHFCRTWPQSSFDIFVFGFNKSFWVPLLL
jgi:hypothetical protein